MGVFSSKEIPKKVEVTAIDRTILDLKNSRDRLQKYRKQLEIDNDKLLQRAKIAKQNNKQQQAIGLLRLRKYKIQQLENCENQLLNILQMVDTIDSKQNEKQILQAMANGKDTLKQMHQETTVEHVLELFDQIQEQHDVETEINDILKDNVPELSLADEQAIEAELNALQAELEPTTTLPEVPTHKLPEIKTPTEIKQQPEKKPERVAVPG